MTIRDLHKNLRVAQSLAPAARVDGTAEGTGVDLRGYDSALAAVSFGAWTDGTHAPKIQHSDDGSDYADAEESDIDGAFTAVSGSSGSNTVQTVGYVGAKRYVRVVITVSGATSGAISSANVVCGHPRNAPV